MFSFACQKRTRKAPATFEAREAAGCGSLRLLRALGGTRILQAAAPTAPPCFGHWPRSSPLQTKGCSPLIIPKLLDSIQKIQVASLKDFLCSADLKPLSRYATAPPSGSKRTRKLCGLPRNFTALPKPPSMREVASPTGLDGRSPYLNHSFSRTSCASSLKWEQAHPQALQSARKLYRIAKGSPFGRAGA